MTLTQLPTLITLAILLLAIFELAHWLNQRGLLNRTPGPSPKLPAAWCQWCIHLAGSECTNPKLPRLPRRVWAGGRGTRSLPGAPGA
jgi:hypothetical protein